MLTLCTPSSAFFLLLFCLQGPVGGVEEVPPFQPQVHTYVCDVGKRESVYSTAEKVRREVGDVDILINNAGVVSGHHLLECPDELIERTMVVNCHAHFWVSQSVARHDGRTWVLVARCSACRQTLDPSTSFCGLWLESCNKVSPSTLFLHSSAL